MIGYLYVLTPSIGLSVPLLWPIAISAAGALGYKLLTSTRDDALLRGELNTTMKATRSLKLEVDHKVTEIMEEEVKRDDILRFEKDEITVVFKKDLRGRFTVEVSGPDTMTKRELEFAGQEFLGAVYQQFAYNRMAAEMERRGANIIGEEVNENGDIVLKLRRWE